MKKYDHKEIEAKWQKIWEDTGLYKTQEDPGKENYYALVMFPYPSGDLHCGHWYNFGPGDTVARYHRMRGKNVLHPMGFDAFGLPAENAAIKRNIPPAKWTDQNTTNMLTQLKQLGAMYDWDKLVNTSKPDYYKWTQWLFLEMYKAGVAYRQKGLQNWCPKDQTVLANEQTISESGEKGVCVRCGSKVEKKELEQWFWKITDYADRLLSDLDKVEWPDKVKTMQENWIGRSEGAEINFKLRGVAGQDDDKHQVTVFTTRPDTLGGATFLVISPELAQKWLGIGWKASDEVKKYIDEAFAKADVDRLETSREKTGVNTGMKAMNPLTKEEIPVWVADYVLGGYGTGAIMAVPAHDERDWEFAQKFDLPIKTVVVPAKKRFALILHGTSGNNQKAWIPWLKAELEDQGYEVAAPNLPDSEHPEHDAWQEALKPYASKIDEDSIIIGHSLGAPTAVQFIVENRLKIRKLLLVGPTFPDMNWDDYKKRDEMPNNVNIQKVSQHLGDWRALKDAVKETIVFYSLDDPWISSDEVEFVLKPKLAWATFNRFTHGMMHFNHGAGIRKLPEALEYLIEPYTGEGKLINSGQFDGLVGIEAQRQIIKWLYDSKQGDGKKNYKLRDWLISRQRYWGAPIPIIYCEDDGIVPVPEKDLPVVLPLDVEFEPTGQSPLASRPDFYEVDCPKCGKKARRETDTMDTFVDSSWYFLRYPNTKFEDGPFDPEAVKQWLPVDQYMGGIEHAILHLLYARFVTKVLFDQKHIDFDEPFKKLFNQGLILGPDGVKMSKSRGNVVNPDDWVSKYGADTFRMYLMFMGPYDQGGPFDTKGISGTNRFLARVWALVEEFVESENLKLETKNSSLETALTTITHKTIKKVTDDIGAFGFNTAIAALMEMVNELYRLKADLPMGSARSSWLTALSSLLRMLAPIAPHITEELWEQLDGQGSIHIAEWPEYREDLVKDDIVEIAIQVNGKLRGTMVVPIATPDDELKKLAGEQDSVKKHLTGQVLKVIVVPRKLVNFVVKP